MSHNYALIGNTLVLLNRIFKSSRRVTEAQRREQKLQQVAHQSGTNIYDKILVVRASCPLLAYLEQMKYAVLVKNTSLSVSDETKHQYQSQSISVVKIHLI